MTMQPAASDTSDTHSRKRLQQMTRRKLTIMGAVATTTMLTLTGCNVVQDTFQVGEREFTYETKDQAESSSESFRFQGFLPEDATDIRLLAQLNGHEALMRWTSPTVFGSDHSENCTEAAISTSPELNASWLPEALPDEGVLCSNWVIVRSEDIQVAWTNGHED